MSDSDIQREHFEDRIRRAQRERRAEESSNLVPGFSMPLRYLALACFLGMIGWALIIVPIIAFWHDLLTLFGA